MNEAIAIRGYRILDLLGEGAVASVHLAELVDGAEIDAGSGHPDRVALKILRPWAAAEPNIVASFLYEARVLSRLDHPGIMRVHGSGSDDGGVYMAMERLSGQPLDEHLHGGRKLKPARTVELGRQLAAALGHLHERGYVHRDLKPGNLMLCENDRLVLMDFGTVISAEAGIDYETGIYGTPSYLAPEQITLEGTIDARADVYALGMILYLMVAGQRPFYGTRDEVLAAHVGERPAAPSRHARVPPELDELILSMIAKDPDDRPTSGSDVAERLEVMAGSLPEDRGGLGRRVLDRFRR